MVSLTSPLQQGTPLLTHVSPMRCEMSTYLDNTLVRSPKEAVLAHPKRVLAKHLTKRDGRTNAWQRTGEDNAHMARLL